MTGIRSPRQSATSFFFRQNRHPRGSRSVADPEGSKIRGLRLQQAGRAQGADEAIAFVGQHEGISVVDVADIERRLQA